MWINDLQSRLQRAFSLMGCIGCKKKKNQQLWIPACMKIATRRLKIKDSKSIGVRSRDQSSMTHRFTPGLFHIVCINGFKRRLHFRTVSLNICFRLWIAACILERMAYDKFGTAWHRVTSGGLHNSRLTGLNIDARNRVDQAPNRSPYFCVMRWCGRATKRSSRALTDRIYNRL